MIVTRGAQGADWYGPGGKDHFPAIMVDPVDTTGAGDAFAAGFLTTPDWAADPVRACAAGHALAHDVLSAR